MVDETNPEFSVGLSNEEKDDLEKLIKGFKQELSVPETGTEVEDIQKWVKSMNEHLVQIGEMLMKFDTRVKSLYEIIRLSYQKSEIMNERIDAIIATIKGIRNIQPRRER